MSTDPLFAGEPDRAANEDQERRAPLTEYPEEPERGVEPEPDSDADAGIEREHVLGDAGIGGVRDEEARYGAASGAAGEQESGYGTQYGSTRNDSAEYGSAEYGSAEYGSGQNGTLPDSGTQNGSGQNGTVQNGAAQNDIVIAPDQNSDFHTRWREIQAEFIDDPQQAAEHADHLVAEITQAFAAQAEEERNRLSSTWQQKGTQGTEELRLVMRRYRGLIDHMLDH